MDLSVNTTDDDNLTDYLPVHGGDLYRASAYYDIAPHRWLDLSTGINPIAYPHNPIPASAFQRLPYTQPEFAAAVERYFQTDSVLPVPGSQSAIQLLPRCLPTGKVLLPAIGYREHTLSWAGAGAEFSCYRALHEAQAAADIDRLLCGDSSIKHLVVINPNNPTGICLDPALLSRWAERLSRRDGFVVVDEAFIDPTPQASVLGVKSTDNIIVLRSFGKFFGLAGLRLGFVIAKQSVTERLRAEMGCWPVNGVAQWVAAKALIDDGWQRDMRNLLQRNMAKRQRLLSPLWAQIKQPQVRSLPLFMSLLAGRQQVRSLFEHLASAAVLTRVVEVDQQRSMLRIGNIDFNDLGAVTRIERLGRAFKGAR